VLVFFYSAFIWNDSTGEEFRAVARVRFVSVLVPRSTCVAATQRVSADSRNHAHQLVVVERSAYFIPFWKENQLWGMWSLMLLPRDHL
jgi:hypothetical protein